LTYSSSTVKTPPFSRSRFEFMKTSIDSFDAATGVEKANAPSHSCIIAGEQAGKDVGVGGEAEEFHQI
jgi:hypothetical protein